MQPVQPFPNMAIAPSRGWPVAGLMALGFATNGLKKTNWLELLSFEKGNARSQRSPRLTVKRGVIFTLSWKYGAT